MLRISKELKKLRIDHEMSRARMAKMLNITDKNLADIERGRSQMSWRTEQKLYKMFSKPTGENDNLDDGTSDLREAVMASAAVMTIDLTLASFTETVAFFELRNVMEERLKDVADKKMAAKKEDLKKRRAELKNPEPRPEN